MAIAVAAMILSGGGFFLFVFSYRIVFGAPPFIPVLVEAFFAAVSIYTIWRLFGKNKKLAASLSVIPLVAAILLRLMYMGVINMGGLFYFNGVLSILLLVALIICLIAVFSFNIIYGFNRDRKLLMRQLIFVSLYWFILALSLCFTSYNFLG
ncbi:MAG: hypothetical protein FWD58_10405 [Firmicutes bacterium]|nr:hypothetical protein [Bacillota bacterium]